MPRRRCLFADAARRLLIRQPYATMALRATATAASRQRGQGATPSATCRYAMMTTDALRRHLGRLFTDNTPATPPLNEDVTPRPSYATPAMSRSALRLLRRFTATPTPFIVTPRRFTEPDLRHANINRHISYVMPATFTPGPPAMDAVTFDALRARDAALPRCCCRLYALPAG